MSSVRLIPRQGFCHAILGTLRLLPDALLTLGPPCSSFVWLNSATSKRTEQDPYGDESKEYVRRGSLRLGLDSLVRYEASLTHVHVHLRFASSGSARPRMCSRAMMLVIIATARAAYVALEQPNSSQMKNYPDLVFTGKRIQDLIGYWKDQFLPGS